MWNIAAFGRKAGISRVCVKASPAFGRRFHTKTDNIDCPTLSKLAEVHDRIQLNLDVECGCERENDEDVDVSDHL